MNVPFFCENFLYGFGKPGTGPIPSSDKFHVPDAPQYPFDKKRAEALLDEAGYPRKSGGTRFKLRLLPAPWGEDVTLWSIFLPDRQRVVSGKSVYVRVVVVGSRIITKKK